MTTADILRRDTEINFPEFVLLKASAGTGKTHALTLRFTQFLLSEKIKNNDLRQMLAITFTRNAAKEMKTRVLQWLKETYFGEEATLHQLQKLVSLNKEDLAAKAERTLENILSRYSDFRVMTIDSFMAEVFRASAVDLGVTPDFEITLDPSRLIDYAFYRLLRQVAPGSPEAETLSNIVASLQKLGKSEAAFIWDPTNDLKTKFIELYNQLEAMNRRPWIEGDKEELSAVQGEILQVALKIEKIIADSGLRFRQNSTFPSLLEKIKQGFFADLLDKSIGTMPINKPAKSSPQQVQAYELASQTWEEFRRSLGRYRQVYARTFFYPYLKIYDDLINLIAEAKRERGQILLEDINHALSSYLTQGIVPDVYFRLGDRIYHYLIDEFQDTSPVQWFNLKPLIENSLSQGGSLFIVGDTKQAIYGFREADYEIMMNLEKGREYFAPAPVDVRELSINRRSRQKILDFVREIFPAGIKRIEDYAEAAQKSGLDDFSVMVAEVKDKEDSHPGHVEVEFLAAEEGINSQDNENSSGNEEEEETEDQTTRVKNKVQNLLAELKTRGYRYSEVAILAYKNETVKKIAPWLNEKKIPFIPFSALDIRERKVIREILAGLRFLDFPPDDLSFATFLLGDILEKEIHRSFLELSTDIFHDFIRRSAQTKNYPLYTSFRQQFPVLWERYFEPLFRSVNYYPLYDLTTQLYRLLNVFHLFPEEEAALVKLLEVIKEFEGQGKNNLREFLLFAARESADESLWTIDVAAEIDAVRIMTIHKAKGLGFPVVILLLYPEGNISPTFYLQEKMVADDPAARVLVLKLNQKIATASSELKAVYERHHTKEKVNRLNTLYVALTRAAKELYVIGVKGKRKAYPWALFEELGLHSAPDYSPPKEKPLVKRKETEPKEKSILPLKLPAALTPASAQKRTFRHRETKRGELIHAFLASIETLEGNWEEKLGAQAAKLRITEADPELVEEARQAVRRSLEQSSLIEYFKPREGRVVFRELEMVSRKGELFRADRVVIDPEVATVIDFKTGAADETDLRPLYRQQLKNYQDILKEIYPQKMVQGIIFYVDENSWEKVE